MFIAVIVTRNKLYDNLNKKSSLNKIKLNFIVEILSSISTVKSLSIEEQILNRYERLQNRCIIQDHYLSLQQSNINRIVNIFSQANLITVAGCGAILIINNMLTIGGLAACTLLAGRSIKPLNRAMNFWNKLQNIKIAKEGRDKILELHLEKESLVSKTIPLVGKIELKDITIQNIKNFNLTIMPNECITISGNSSNLPARKALLQIISKSIKPDSGEVLLDDKNIEEYNAHNILCNIGFLPEQGHLFEGSILENITSFRNHTFETKAKKIATEIGLDHIIELMPDGYNTKICANSSLMISQGFKQGILIARVLIDEPNIILFDEANSGMDINSDQKLISYLKNLIGKKTIIIISNRPSTYKLATRIIEIT